MGAGLQFQRSVHYQHDRAQADMALALRVLRLAGNRKSANSTLREAWAKKDLKAHPYSYKLPPTRSPLLQQGLLIMSFPLGAIFFQTSTASKEHRETKRQPECFTVQGSALASEELKGI